MREVRFDPDAIEELENAVRWYEDQREGLSIELLDEIDDAIAAAAEGGPRCRSIDGVADELVVKRVLVHRFPYIVYFVEVAEAVRIIAIAHERRRPGYWKQRVR
jgi:toxin ParE1/3/4